MNDAFGVRGVERIGDLNSQIQHQLYRHRLSADPMLERLTVAGRDFLVAENQAPAVA